MRCLILIEHVNQGGQKGTFDCCTLILRSLDLGSQPLKKEVTIISKENPVPGVGQGLPESFQSVFTMFKVDVEIQQKNNSPI